MLKFVSLFLASSICICLQSGYAYIYQTRFPNVTWDDDNWVLQSTYLDSGHYQARASLSNGYIGINLASLGPFFEVDSPVNGDNINGWPLFDRRQTFATVAGFFDVQSSTAGSNFPMLNQLGGESVISGIPHWAGLILEYEGHALSPLTNPLQISNFVSKLDVKSASLSWQFTWSPAQTSPLEVSYSMFLNKLYINRAAVQLRVKSQESVKLSVFDVLDGDCALRTNFVDKRFEEDSSTIWTAVNPLNIPYVTAFVYSTLSGNFSDREMVQNAAYMGRNASSISQSVVLHLNSNETSLVEKHIGIASTDAFDDPQSVAKNASLLGAMIGYSHSLAAHVEEWHSIMPQDSVDRYNDPDGKALSNADIIEQQILAVTNPFHMLQNTVSENAIRKSNDNQKLATNSIGVCGLGSECYGGLIFWDVEVWMQPGLAVAFPGAVKQIANYRAEKYSVAKQNVHESYTSSQNKTSFSNESAIFSWTSGRFGNCTATGPCFDYEYHINGDIALELHNYYVVTGDHKTFKEKYFPLFNSIAQVYSDLLYYNTTTGTYMLANATDPDEYANEINNPGYTMVLIKTILNTANNYRSEFGLPMNAIWTHQAQNIEIPTDESAEIYLEYTGMNGSISVKQADVVLIDDFLNYRNPYTISDLEFYAGRQSANGPGMTYGVFSTIASGALPNGCADFTYHLYGSTPYAKAPWFQFSEQLVDDYSTNGGTHPAYPFLTGMGGANRVAVYGFLGLKLTSESFNINPTLPPQIENLSYRTIFWQGHAIRAIANATHTTLTRLPARALSSANPRYADANIPVTISMNTLGVYQLAPNGTLVIPNRQPYLAKTIINNLAQCRPTTSDRDFAPGQFPLSAVDGAVSSKWQPVLANITSRLTVFLGNEGIQPISGFYFNWAQAPPRSWSIAFSNASDPSSYSDMLQVISSNEVLISDPYNPLMAAEVMPYIGNTTNVTLDEPVYGGEWAMLTIKGSQGNQAMESVGATVAEWGIIAVNSSRYLAQDYRDEL